MQHANNGFETCKSSSGAISYSHIGTTGTAGKPSYTVSDTEGAESNSATVSTTFTEPKGNKEILVAQAATGEITYTHDGSVATNDSFTYTIADDQGGVSSQVR